MVLAYNGCMVKHALSILGNAAKDWQKDNSFQKGAAISFFATFSLAPLLIIGISISGFFFGEEDVRIAALKRIEGFIGADGITFLSDVMEKTFQPTDNAIAAMIAIITLLFGAAGMFFQIRESIFRMWEDHIKKPDRVKQLIKGALLPFLFVFGTGIVFIVMSLFRTTLAVVSELLSENVDINYTFAHFVDYAFSMLVTILVFMIIYRIFSPVKYPWRFALFGAVVSAIILEIGKFFIDLYIKFVGISVLYGAAGSLVVVLFWIFFSALIFLYGAEVAKVAALDSMKANRKWKFLFFKK